MSNNFGYIDIILLGMIAGFIILRLRNILGRKTGHETKIYPGFAEKKFNVPNRNGRVYPEHILKRENERYQDVIRRGGSISELNHPESSLVDLERSSHRVLETWWDGNILMGKLEILTSPAYHQTGVISCVGDIAANLLRHDVTLGISSRGVGS